MIFSSWQYLLFLPIIVLLYWKTEGKTRLFLLVTASYFFYMSWLPVYGIFLAIITTVNWMLGLGIDTFRNSNWKRKALLGVGLFVNLGCLAYYKYTNFALTNIYSGFAWCIEKLGMSAQYGSQSDPPLLNVLLPLGISFFVFEFVHYIVDIYRGDRPIRSWLEFAGFVAFFPSQIAGPIKRFQDFMPQLAEPTPWSKPLFFEAMTLIVQGLFKKVAIADPIGLVVFNAFANTGALSTPDALIACFGFVIQVYCDFTGYTDIGRGSALLLGIRLPENFNLPYLAADLADFWRRWHISLSYWLRDYVYISLGGSRKNRYKNWRNLFITMVACGLWHGAAWHYVIFGCMQGVGLIVHREWKNFVAANELLKKNLSNSFMAGFNVCFTFLFVSISYTVFRAPDMGRAFDVLTAMFSTAAGSELWQQTVRAGTVELLVVYMSFWLVTEFLKHRKLKSSSDMVNQLIYPTPLRLASWTAAVILTIAARPTEATPFVYFQF